MESRVVLERIFGYKFHVLPLLNPFLGLQISELGEYSGVTEDKRETPIIVSLTSYEGRFEYLPKALYSLLTQKRKPDRIILWLDLKYENVANIPYEITRFVKNGLEIRFVEDLGSYTKAIHAFREFSDAVIVTADDDIYYPKDWLDKLYMSYAANPEDIHVHRAHRVKLVNGRIAPYSKWKKQIHGEGAEYSNFLTGAGGVLYPPKCFTKEVLRRDIFLPAAPKADDIWFWVMALIHGRKIRVVKDHMRRLICTSIRLQLFGDTLFSKNKYGRNDEQLNNIMKYYYMNVMSKLEGLV